MDSSDSDSDSEQASDPRTPTPIDTITLDDEEECVNYNEAEQEEVEYCGEVNPPASTDLVPVSQDESSCSESASPASNLAAEDNDGTRYWPSATEDEEEPSYLRSAVEYNERNYLRSSTEDEQECRYLYSGDDSNEMPRVGPYLSYLLSVAKNPELDLFTLPSTSQATRNEPEVVEDNIEVIDISDDELELQMSNSKAHKNLGSLMDITDASEENPSEVTVFNDILESGMREPDISTGSPIDVSRNIKSESHIDVKTSIKLESHIDISKVKYEPGIEVPNLKSEHHEINSKASDNEGIQATFND